MNSIAKIEAEVERYWAGDLGGSRSASGSWWCWCLWDNRDACCKAEGHKPRDWLTFCPAKEAGIKLFASITLGYNFCKAMWIGRQEGEIPSQCQLSQAVYYLRVWLYNIFNILQHRDPGYPIEGLSLNYQSCGKGWKQPQNW